jgi:hypothetical protein
VTRPASSERKGPGSDQPAAQILPFRQRGSRNPPRNAPRPPGAPDADLDLQKYERADNQPDDFRHRMLMNGLALAVTAGLVAGGIWIADVMAHMRKDQDCVLAGRPGCTKVDAPIQLR